MTKPGEPVLSFRRAAVRLGWEDTRASADRLQNMVRGCERQTKKRITVRRGKIGGWSGVTMQSLRKHLPWLFRAGARERTELEQRFLQHLRDIDERAEDAASAVIAKTVDPQIDELHGRCSKNDRRLDAIEREFAAVSRAVAGLTSGHQNDVNLRKTTA
jgi:hypothetical protein